MKIQRKQLDIETKNQFELVDITMLVADFAAQSGIQNGSLTIFCPHTTASVRLNHNENLLMQDIMKALYRLIPVDISYSHDLFEIRQNAAPNERSNGHAHVKALLLGSSENLIVENGKLTLGDKQSIFFIELDGGRSRHIRLQLLGE